MEREDETISSASRIVEAASSAAVAADYTDYANVMPPDVPEPVSISKGKAAQFVYKLYDMLARVEEDGFSNAVCWQPHGRCFMVRDAEAFRGILPRYFGFAKMTSFTRQLNVS